MAGNAELSRALYFLLFTAGGPGDGVPIGLLMARIGVRARMMRLLPRWITVFGVALGVYGELSSRR